VRFLSRLSCRSTYLLAAITLLSFSAKADSFGFTGGLQQYTVSASGVYQITADGASGAGFNPYSMVGGGLGASMTGTFDLSVGVVIDVYVGQEGSIYGGGGGGTFVLLDGSSSPLLVAGGGGGVGIPIYFSPTDEGQNASLTSGGNSSIDDAPSGTGGGGGHAALNQGNTSGGAGGGGWDGNGQNGNANGLPGFFSDGGQGFWTGSPVLAGGSLGGGYGGGGGEGQQGAGGGGGYSGGGGGNLDSFGAPAGGGGGGSYVNLSALSSSAVLLTAYGDGSAEITPEFSPAPEPASVWLVTLSLLGAAAFCASKA
jgi:hypothetical protein